MGARREKVALDLDDVVLGVADDYLLHVNERYEAGLTREDYQVPGPYWTYFQSIGGIEFEEGSKRWHEFLDNHLLDIRVDSVAINAIHQLKRDRDLDIVTARYSRLYDTTLTQIERDLPGVFGAVHFVELWGDPGDAHTKGEICKEIGAEYLVDDNVDHCRSAAELSIRGLLFGEYGWNMHVPAPPGVERVPDWPAVVRYFNGQ